MTEQSIEKILSRLDSLNQIGITLSKENDIDLVFEKILIGAQKLTGADAGSLYLIQKDTLVFTVISNDTFQTLLGGSTGEEIPFNGIQLYDDRGEKNLFNVVTCAAHEKKTINIPDAYNDTTYDFMGTKSIDSQTGYHSQSFLTIPLMDYDEEVLGVLQLINRIDEDTGEITEFSEADQHLGESLASQAAIKVKNQLLLDYKLQQERVKNELEIAGKIQHNLVPRDKPQFPGTDIAFYFKPAKDIGGDFFDVFIREDQSELFVTVADAAGKGVPACLYSLTLRSILRSSYNFFNSPADILKNANNLFHKDAASSANFATTVTVGYQPDTEMLTYASCGHPPAYLRRKNGDLLELQSGGMTLGILTQDNVPQESVKIRSGDLLLLYSDGLTDAMNAKGEFFGEERVKSFLINSPYATPTEIIDKLKLAIEDFQKDREFFDDTTIVAVSFY